MASLLIVDGANVVGSRPDGWWRDRPGAARRLHDRLFAAGLDGDVILVLEGQARSGVPIGVDGRVRTVHASRDGDSTIVDLVADLAAHGEVTVVTADRGLTERVTTLGAGIERPGWLLEQLA